MVRKRGFTLIELLVVIAIIGILAAMLFPVFARARESARKIQCLSNVKNIAMAMQMYLTDYDAFAPTEHDAAVLDWVRNRANSDSEDCYGDVAFRLNPYLRAPVVLDEYIKNRDVWRCPSAFNEGHATWINGFPDWFAHEQVQSDDVSGCCQFWGGPCWGEVYPNGWGGERTDSSSEPEYFPGVFRYGLGVTRGSYDRKTAAIPDPSNWVVVSDRGSWDLERDYAEMVVWPDMCRLQCSTLCHDPSAEGCSDAVSAGCFAYPDQIRDTSFMRGKMRHMGGSNLGFADGHAKWIPGYEILKRSYHKINCRTNDAKIDNPLQPLEIKTGGTSDDPEWMQNCDCMIPIY